MSEQITNVVDKGKIVGIPEKKPSQTPHCISLNSCFLAVKLRLTLTDKGVLMRRAWPSFLFCPFPESKSRRQWFA